ncbi:hypothetical protein NUACC21_26030 [Scytonema sp. NUACC21]
MPSTFCLLTPTRAQINPDNSLGTESSRVTPNTFINGLPADQIDGGAQRGSNLFHSFTQFNVDDGQRVYFTNPIDVKNIFTRVTGGQGSNILGTLGVNGNANLFLINPNGILFGKNAQLDVRSSFVATTANGLQFENLGNFSATNPEVPSSLLTINPSALFFNQINPTASIQNNSIADAGKDPAGIDVLGLRVPDGKSLLLIGGNVSMDGGWAIANGGRIELGGLAEAGSIGIRENGNSLSLSFPDSVQRGDISLTNGAVVGVIGGGGGSIAINARSLDILAGSELFGGIRPGLGTTGTLAGDITIDATEEIKLAGTNSLIFNSVQLEAVGNAGDITINTGSLEVTGGAQIDSFTRGRGNAGNITIQAKDTVTFDGVGTNGFPSASFSNVQPGATGNGGSINITARSLSLTNGGQLGVDVRRASDTLLGGRGNGGTLNINLRDALTISGEDSGIFANLGTGAVGRGGDVNIQAGNLLIKDDGEIFSGTSGQGDSGNISITARDTISLDAGGIYSNVNTREAVGNAGKIDITTGSVAVTNSGQINSFTRGQGNAGNITIQARDAVTFDGMGSDKFFSGSFSNVQPGATGNGGSINITARSLSLTNGGLLGVGVREASDTLPGGRGNGGDININTNSLLLTNGAEILADSEISGASAGDININASLLTLNNQSIIKSESVADADGGNINFNIRGFLLMRHNSQISTNAGTAQQGGNGGNININSKFIIAVPKENSDITANAFRGRGGSVRINSQGIFGIEVRSQQTEKSDITASSNLGVQGQISIEQPEVQPTQTLIELPTEVVDASNQIAQTCPKSPNAKPLGRFVVTGRGSLPPNPLEPLVGTNNLIPLASLDGEIFSKLPNASSNPNLPVDSPQIIEAQGWVKTADGNIVLVAQASQVTPSTITPSAVCPVSHTNSEF